MNLPGHMLEILMTQFTILFGMYVYACWRARPLPPECRPFTPKPKALCEKWFLMYGIFWMCCFSGVVAFQLYEAMDKWAYFCLCGGLASPLLLQPILAPNLTEESHVPILQRHCMKANVWIAIYSFLGNYWGTHYFYCVLQAKYTLPFLPDHQLNGVPICMYFATHFYFSFYHAMGSRVLRWVDETFRPTTESLLFKIACICVMSYVVAFLETFSISAFPYYTFEDRDLVYTVGSAFYACYLLISFPMFARLDNKQQGGGSNASHTMTETCLESFGSWMIIMCILDFIRLGLGVEFSMRG